MHGQEVQLPLLDRDAELAALTEAIEAVRIGDGRAVLVEGMPGAGKTRLLAAARQLATDAGLRTLTARGSEMEREYPYGGVRQLFEAAVLGPARDQWLNGPAAAASQVFMPESTVDPSAFATLNGLYWLTSNAASAGPVALFVDDLHWIDRPSHVFLQFLLRRLEGLPILVILATRPVETDLRADVEATPSGIVLSPASLSTGAATQLAEHFLGERPADRFADACRQATEGNPLLLVELLRTLRAEGVAPTDARVDALDHIVPSTLARVALLRLRRLPGNALAVARAIAVLGPEAPASLVAELAEVDARTVADAIDAMAVAEVLEAGPGAGLGFVHPVLRDAIYRDLRPVQREQAHARAAELLHARAAAPEQTGAHLLMTEPAGLPWASAVLSAAAADASHRGASESAITFLRRAVAERPGDVDPDLLFRLGMTEAAIDPAAAVDHLEAARRASGDPRMRARIGEMMTRILVFFDPAEAIQIARRTRDELPPDAVDRRASLLAMERHSGRFSGADWPEDPDTIPDSPSGRMLRAVDVWNRFLSGGTAAECAALAAEVLGLDDSPHVRPTLTSDTTFTAMVASAVLIFADDLRVQVLWDEWYAESVRLGRAHVGIAAGIWNGLVHQQLGRLADAEAAIRAAMAGPGEWGPGTGTVPAHSLANLADILVARGDLAGAEKVLSQVPDMLRPLDSEGALQARRMSLRLLVARGRHQDALQGFDEVLPRLETVRNPAWGDWRLVRAEALAHVGETDEAHAVVTEDLALARHWGTPGPIGRALTQLGVLEGSTQLLEEAVEITRSPFARLEHAGALLALGRHVRQDGRPKDARGLLRDAHDLASQCGAEPLAKLARDELATAGGRARTQSGAGSVTLTASERRVAELAASGLSNRDVAQALYLSPKTVEVHLSNAYRKLGIRARSELPAALAPLATDAR